MLLGLVVYIWGQKYLTHVGNLERKSKWSWWIFLWSTFGDLLKSKTQLVFTITFCFILIWMV
jgi:POT family proton-dependent oligopeptide transporter